MGAPRSRLRKWLLRVAAVGALLFMLDSVARQMLYPAPAVPVPSPPPPPLEEVRLDLAAGGHAVAWASIDPGLPPDAPLAIFFHGNGENLETLRWAGLFDELRSLRVAILAADFPGYGRSPGSPSEEGLLATGDAAVAWARKQHPGRPVVVCGWSLGAALAIATAARHPGEVQGLVALSPWTTLDETARLIFPGFVVKALLRESYDSRAAAREVRVPALVIHGERDDLIPVSQGKEIAETLAGATRWVPVARAGHNDLLGERVVWEEMEGFFRQISG
jgi:uncharacterized protein